MPLTPEEATELARLLNARMGLGRTERPKLRLVVPPSPKLLDPIFRDQHLKRVLFLQRAYRLQWLVDQECFGVASLSCMEDCDLIRLLNLMERARECIMDGVSFDDAGLVRHRDNVDPGYDEPVRESRSLKLQRERAAIATAKLSKPAPFPTTPPPILTDEQPPF